MRDALATFIHDARDAREYQRAVAVQMVEEGIAPATIMHVLHVSAPFISKWKRIYAESGVEGLRIKYKGGIPHLSAAARQETIAWLKAQDSWDLAALQTYVHETFAVEYASPQSYYALFHDAGLSWKKAQATNPKKKMRSSQKSARKLARM